MSYPTFSITAGKGDRIQKLKALLEIYRREDDTVSRSEIFWFGIDALYAIKCPSQRPVDLHEVHEEAA